MLCMAISRGKSGTKWRSGVKHDCTKIMELKPTDEQGVYANGHGEHVELEPAYLYPMLKSSDLAHDRDPTRYMLVPQKEVGEDTTRIKISAPPHMELPNSARRRIRERVEAQSIAIVLRFPFSV